MKKLFRSAQFPIAALFIISLAIGLFTVKDYGQSWDEPGIYNYGDYALKAYRFFFHPQTMPDFNGGDTHSNDLTYYGPSYFIIATVLAKVLKLFPGWTLITAWHFIDFLTFQTGIVIFYFLAKRWMSASAALGAALLFAVQPLLWGHAFINPKDIPFTTFFIASIYFGFKLMDDPSAPKSFWVVAAGFVLGLTASFRVIGPFAGILVFLYGLSKSPRKTILTVIPYSLFAALICYLTWPYLWTSPVQHFLESARYMSKFPSDQTVLFAGSLFSAEHLPWNYFPTLLLIQLTEPSIILFIAGIGIAIWQFYKKQREPLLIFLLWFLLPTIAIIASGSTLYDNARQLFFLLPPLFLLAGLSLDELFSRFTQWTVKLLVIGIIAITAIIPIAQLHPYEYIYYNSFTGGTQGAFRSFEMDYWGTSFKEAAQYLNTNIPSGSSVAVFGPFYVMQSYVRPDLKLFNNPKAQTTHYAYAVISTRLDIDQQICSNGQTLGTINIGKVILTVIKKLPVRSSCD